MRRSIYSAVGAAFRTVPLCLALLVGALPAPAQVGQSDPRFAGARKFILEAMAEQRLPSVAIAVARDGKILWEEGFGWADQERQVPATPQTLYSLASISKPITATGLMRLVEAGKVELDRPANDYLAGVRLTGLAGDASGATVRRVLSHTAGLPLHYEFFYAGDPYRRRDTDAGIERYGILVNPPGEVYEYSNLGYGILERIIERVTGRDYAEFVRAEVFAPLGMSRSVVSTGEGLEDAAVRYDAKGRPIPFYDFDHRGGSAVYSSAHDLVRFGIYHLGDRQRDQQSILRARTLTEMQQPITPGSSTQGYGLGWIVTADDHGYRRVSHTGGMPGVATVLNLYPEEGVAVVVLTNTSNRVVGRIAQEIAAAVLPGYGERLRQQVASDGGSSTTPFQPPAELLGRWEGTLRTHEGEVPLTLEFQPDGDVHVQLGDELTTLLNEVSFRNGQLTGRFAGTIPTADARRHPHMVGLNLRLRDGTLSGQGSALTTTDVLYFALSSYVQLRRASTSQ